MVYVNVLCMVYVRGDVKTSGVVECRTGSGWIFFTKMSFLGTLNLMRVLG